MATQESNSRGISTVVLLAGIWTLLSPYILRFAGINSSATSNNIIVGALITLFAIVSLSAARASWSRIVNAILGIWLFLSPFILAFSGLTSALWNNLILGAITIIFAVWSASTVGHYGNLQMR